MNPFHFTPDGRDKFVETILSEGAYEERPSDKESCVDGLAERLDKMIAGNNMKEGSKVGEFLFVIGVVDKIWSYRRQDV